jgi:tetratricopeptide (TPR) repeat protein
MLLKEGGKAKEAEEELRLALQSNPAKELERDAQFQLAILLQKAGKLEEAAGLFQSLLSTPSQERFSPQMLQWLAEFKSEKKAHQESLDAARLLVEKNKEPAWQQAGWCLIGRANLGLGDKAKAEEAFRKALDAKANTSFIGETVFRLGELTLAEGKYDDAVKFYKQAAEKANDEAQLGIRARAYIGLAKASKGLGDWASASRYFMSVSILYDDPELVPECFYEAAGALKKQGKDDESRKLLKELRERYPDNEWAKKPDPQ